MIGVSIASVCCSLNVLLIRLQLNFKTFTTKPAITLDRGRKSKVHMTFRGRPGHLLNVLSTFILRPVSTGVCRNKCKTLFQSSPNKCMLTTAFLFQIANCSIFAGKRLTLVLQCLSCEQAIIFLFS